MADTSPAGASDHFLTVSLAVQRLREAARQRDPASGLSAMKTLLPTGASDLCRFLAMMAKTAHEQGLQQGGGGPQVRVPRASRASRVVGPGIISRLLPLPELLATVFTHLTNQDVFVLSGVSKACHTAANEPSTWRSRLLLLNLRKKKSVTETGTLLQAVRSISKRQEASLWRHVQGLVLPEGLRGCSKYMPGAIHKMTPNIRVLDLQDFAANSSLLEAILEAFA